MTDSPLLRAARPIFITEYDADTAAPVTVPAGYPTARLMVKRRGLLCGTLLLPVTDGAVDPAAVTAQTAGLQPHPFQHEDAELTGLPSVAVAVPTHNRAPALERALASMIVNPLPAEFIVVDNCPADDSTRLVVERLAAGEPRLRYLREDRKGASSARNRALAEATTEIVVFADDDVEVDEQWVTQHLLPYADPVVTCVTGPAYAARLDTAEEVLCEASIGWTKGDEARRYSLQHPPQHAALFPFSPGLFGAGMNFSVRRRTALDLGAFDPVLGAGVPTQGSEDGDFFVRLVRAGYTLVYQPTAFLYHHHRSTEAAYTEQRDGYAIGLGAFMAKLAASPRNWLAIAKRIPAVIRQQRDAKLPDSVGAPPMPRFRNEYLMALGAWRYTRTRLPGRAGR